MKPSRYDLRELVDETRIQRLSITAGFYCFQHISTPTYSTKIRRNRKGITTKDIRKDFWF